MIYGENQELILKQLSTLNIKVKESPIPNTMWIKDVDNIYSRKIIEPLIS